MQVVPSVCQMSAVYSRVSGWHLKEHSAASVFFVWQVVSIDLLVVTTYKAQAPVSFESLSEAGAFS